MPPPIPPASLSDPNAPRQLRRVEVPLAMLVQYIDRRTEELADAKIHHAQVDDSGHKLFLYIETAVEAPLQQTIKLDWQQIFGIIPCEGCARPCPVEDITVCSHAIPTVRKALQDGSFKCPVRVNTVPPRPDSLTPELPEES